MGSTHLIMHFAKVIRAAQALGKGFDYLEHDRRVVMHGTNSTHLFKTEIVTFLSSKTIQSHYIWTLEIYRGLIIKRAKFLYTKNTN